ncbi:hypothetical protein UPYG_G00159140 [Umbra pygmaea]|uniref:Immunoglobulin C1-set domain-containing protein n=1 Tax=Umbra pygmaea TaxID=75934 RepID=A0ABD0WZ24_UMBPY
MQKLYLVLILLSIDLILNAGLGAHSLWAFATCISGKSSFAECTVVLKMDDIQVGYFDSNIEQFIHKGHTTPDETDVDMAKDATYVFGHMFLSLKRRLSVLKYRYNSTGDIDVNQRLAGCEILKNGEPALFLSTDAFNTVFADVIYYNMTHYSYKSGNLLSPWSEVHQTYAKWRYLNIYLPICIKALKKYLEREKDFVMRKVRPRVRLIQKALQGGGLQVCCLAFGFYPRHINLTLQMDAQPVADHELSGGEVLPSGDGTYQLRRCLEVSTEQLRERHKYTCSTTHLSLDNKLDVSWIPQSGLEAVVSIVTVGLIIITLLAIFLLCVRRQRTAADSGVTQPSSSRDEPQAAERIGLSSHES